MKSMFPAVLVVLILSGIVAADPVTLFSQPIDPGAGPIISDVENTRRLTDFTLPAGGIVTDVCWWGLYPGFDGTSLGPTQFLIGFFDEFDFDTPPVYQTTVFAVPQATAYQSNVADQGPFPVYRYESAIAPTFSVPAGQQMWISIAESDPRTTHIGYSQWAWSHAIGDTTDYAVVLKGEAVPLPGAAVIGLLGLGTASAALRRRRALTK